MNHKEREAERLAALHYKYMVEMCKSLNFKEAIIVFRTNSNSIGMQHVCAPASAQFEKWAKYIAENLLNTDSGKPNMEILITPDKP